MVGLTIWHEIHFILDTPQNAIDITRMCACCMFKLNCIENVKFPNPFWHLLKSDCLHQLIRMPNALSNS